MEMMRFAKAASGAAFAALASGAILALATAPPARTAQAQPIYAQDMNGLSPPGESRHRYGYSSRRADSYGGMMGGYGPNGGYGPIMLGGYGRNGYGPGMMGDYAPGPGMMGW